MNDFIFRSKKNNNNSNFTNEFYTIKGMEDTIDPNNNCRLNHEIPNKVFAKKLYREDNTHRLYIRVGSNGKLYNPTSIYGEEKINTFLDRVCKDGIKFKEVNQKIFDFYLNFLNTKNIAWLNNAEREIS
jgi:hypothetical protein